MTIGTLVVIVLAVLVLVVLALGFTTGWTNLYSRMTSFFSSVNVDSVAQACSVAAAAQNKYDYCCTNRSVVFADKKTVNKACVDLVIANQITVENQPTFECGEICGAKA